jgi:hypothetical protein
VTEANDTADSKNDKPAQCPNCGAKDIKRLAYGYPFSGPPLEPDEVLSGGCCLRGDEPKYWCPACDHQWGLAFDEQGRLL